MDPPWPARYDRGMLLGRGSERAAIDGLIRGASQGVSGVLLLRGDAGCLGAARIAMLFAASDTADLPADPTAQPVLQLGGLDKDPSLQLLSQATRAIAAPVATAIWRASGGNPPAPTEIPRLLSER